MRIWIDLANSPHPLLFAPVARTLEELGHDIQVTARDHAQTLDLARQSWPDVTVIGADSPGSRVAKIGALASRASGLRAWASTREIDAALSHNSYAQIAVARAIAVPSVTAMDFEHQPANHLAFRLARRILVPQCLPVGALRRQGAHARKLMRYPGLKEELYVADFEPDPNVLPKLRVERNERTVVIVARTPPTRAAYHQFGNPLFEAALRKMADLQDIVCIALARYPEQRAALRQMELPHLVVPERAVDARSLLFAADAVLGAGGTMTREAAVMGVPSWSLYVGPQPQVDRWLERTGRLRRLSDVEQLNEIAPRRERAMALTALRARAAELTEFFVDAVVSVGHRRPLYPLRAPRLRGRVPR